MLKTKIGIILIILILIGITIPIGFSNSGHENVITYGETTYHNQEYKKIVDDFFRQQANVDINNVESQVVTASEVNRVSSSITHNTYDSNQIFSSAYLDLSDQGAIKVTTDTKKITVITAQMYISALKSAGITHGHVYVTSTVTATGESALTGIMHAYEEATNVNIPENVEQAANDEIYTEAEVVENNNVSADEISKLVEEIKNTVITQNITDHTTIVNLIQNYTVNHNINLTNSDIEKLATAIENIQSVQGDVESYQSQLDTAINNTSGGSLQSNILNIFN